MKLFWIDPVGYDCVGNDHVGNDRVCNDRSLVWYFGQIALAALVYYCCLKMIWKVYCVGNDGVGSAGILLLDENDFEGIFGILD